MIRPTPANQMTDPAHVSASENALELAIGRQVRHLRKQQSLTITDLCKRTVMFR